MEHSEVYGNEYERVYQGQQDQSPRHVHDRVIMCPSLKLEDTVGPIKLHRVPSPEIRR